MTRNGLFQAFMGTSSRKSENPGSMAQELQGCGAVVYEIGDGQKVSTILHAVWDGYEVGNNI